MSLLKYATLTLNGSSVKQEKEALVKTAVAVATAAAMGDALSEYVKQHNGSMEKQAGVKDMFKDFMRGFTWKDVSRKENLKTAYKEVVNNNKSEIQDVINDLLSATQVGSKKMHYDKKKVQEVADAIASGVDTRIKNELSSLGGPSGPELAGRTASALSGVGALGYLLNQTVGDHVLSSTEDDSGDYAMPGALLGALSGAGLGGLGTLALDRNAKHNAAVNTLAGALLGGLGGGFGGSYVTDDDLPWR